MRSAKPKSWIAYARPNPNARLRLYCFHCAGRGASLYRGWAEALPATVQVCPVQLPGRETLMPLKPHPAMAPLIDALVEAIGPVLTEPFALFGHSMGGLVAFELARALRRLGRPGPAHLFVAAYRSPQLPATRPPFHDLPDADLIEALHRHFGLPEAVMKERGLLEVLLPMVRADFAVCDTYEYMSEPPFSFGITAFGGQEDQQVSQAALAAWQEQTTGPFRLHMLPGGHFFVQEAPDAFLPALARELALTVPRLP